jgi:hypothetical protein
MYTPPLPDLTLRIGKRRQRFRDQLRGLIAELTGAIRQRMPRRTANQPRRIAARAYQPCKGDVTALNRQRSKLIDTVVEVLRLQTRRKAAAYLET